ncbi:30S ribosomal protein S12 methylthiotransferase RimO [Filifactor villosus]|uniref:Ribosomal protein uS12 methylthiotransferase RimO n=1 Tax=Filifactor villosus TaxID=29374 RepID=A0ABV9QNW7_9FIRM
MQSSCKNVYISTLGCAKNQVDSEMMLAIMEKDGMRSVAYPEEADIIVVNTCGFIESAKEESILEILSLSKLKVEGKLDRLIVTGCLAQRYSEELMKEIPEIDFILGTTSFPQIAQAIRLTGEGVREKLLDDIDLRFSEMMTRSLMTEEPYAYLKIAEGCDNLCTYCIIPKLRGRYRSRRPEDIVSEARSLASSGIRELIVIAQDTTKYGVDLYGRKMLGELLSELDKIEDLKWIRVLYSYPEDIDASFISAVKNGKRLLPYFDMPIQHCSDSVLKRMNRKTSKKQLLEKIETIRKELPEAVLRTTLITGFPGETQEEFEEVLDFVKKVGFDRLGVFSYSNEEGTPAARMKDQIEEEVKEERRSQIMNLQQRISYEKNQTLYDKEIEVLIEEQVEEGIYTGRSWRDMVEIDGIIYVHTNKELEIGSFVKVRINDVMEYDLIGGLVDEYTE